MNLAYFQKQRDCFATLAERLETFRRQIREPGIFDAVYGKVVLSDAQVSMRQSNRLTRVGLACKQLVAGYYHRFARGLKSFVVDAFF